MSRRIISTWLCLDDKHEESVYYQVGSKSSSLEFQKVYWRCIFDFFAYNKRFNPDYEYLLFVNKRVWNILIDKINIIEELEKLNVNIIYIPFTYKLPNGYYNAWHNQLFELDIFQHCVKLFNNDDIILLLDSDCIITSSLNELFDLCDSKGCITYIIDHPLEYNINGITRIQMKNLFEELTGSSLNIVPTYHGGEFAMVKIRSLSNIIKEFEPVFNKMVDKFNCGENVKFNEEAHFLSFLYYLNDFSGGEANAFIKRMWNAPRYYNIQNDDFKFAIWHLPASKKTGFRKLFKNYDKYRKLSNEKYLELIKQLFLKRDMVAKRYAFLLIDRFSKSLKRY
jgi:hypothetical protein